MSTTPEPEFDLEKLFLPAWAQEAPNVNKYASCTGEDRRDSRGFDRSGGRRPPRRDGNRGPGGPGQRGPRPAGQAHGADRSDARRPRSQERADNVQRREPPPPPAKVDVTILPDDKSTELLARQIRVTGRAYPLFDIAHLILQKPERQMVRFDVIKKQGGGVEQPLYLCALDDTLWLSEDEAVEHLLTKHFDTFYKAERTKTEPPKGTYTFVAQCGMSGIILGPPNYHDYQNQLRKLHAERFSRMPFETFKSRVKIVRDEAIVKKWIEDQSYKTEYICLNVPEAKKLASREEVQKHFRETHLPNIVKSVETHTYTGQAARQLRCSALQRALRSCWEDQRRFPLKLATVLSQQFASHGLQFFKVNRSVTHVSVARPHYLDLDATPVSEGVRRIVDFINATPKCSRRKLTEALVPAAALAPAKPAPAPAAQPTATPAPAAAATAEAPAAPATTDVAAVPGEAPAADASPELNALNADLHWLIHQGHVIEFANGVLETAKKPAPKPPKPEPKADKTADKAAAAAPAVPAGETPAATTLAEQVPANQAVSTPVEAPVPAQQPEAAPAAPATPEASAAPQPEAQKPDAPAQS